MHVMGWGIELIHPLAVGGKAITSMRGHRWCRADMLTTIPAPVCWRRRGRTTRAWWRSKFLWLRQFVGHVSRIILRMGLDMVIIISVIFRSIALCIIAAVHGIVHFISVIWNRLSGRYGSNTTISVHARAIFVGLGPGEVLWWCAVLNAL